MEDKDLKQTTEYLDIPEEATSAYNPDLTEPPMGKAWKRKSDGFMIYSSMVLGKLFYLNGKKLRTPLQEKPEDYELVDEPEM